MSHDLSSISTTRIEVIGGNMNAYGVQIRFQVTDLAHITSVSVDVFPYDLPCTDVKARTDLDRKYTFFHKHYNTSTEPDPNHQPNPNKPFKLNKHCEPFVGAL